MFRIKKDEYINKTFRLPLTLVKEMEQIAQNFDVSLNNLVIQCCQYALDNLEEGAVDANTSQWAKDYMLSAKEQSIVQGDEHGNLNGKDVITRMDAMVMIARAIGADNGTIGMLSSFTDSSQIPEYAKPYVARLVEMGMVKGYTDGSIGADETITRAELFTLIARIMK